MGSGVIINEAGLILTAAHVLPGPGEEVVVVLSDGRQVKAESLGLNKQVDSAIARITEEGIYPYAEMAEAGTVWESDWCIAFGHGGGVQTDRPAPMRLGRVLHVTSEASAGSRWIITDCTVISGDSGGPLFNLDGKVIGIHSNIGMSVLVNRHVPISAYHTQWDELNKAGLIDRPPPPADPIVPGLQSLPSDIQRAIERRLNKGDDHLKAKLDEQRNDEGKIALTPEQAAELLGRDDLIKDIRDYQQKMLSRDFRTLQIENAQAGSAGDGQESDVSKQSRKTRLLILEKKRERMLDRIAQDLRKTHGKIAKHVLDRFTPATSMAGPVTAEVVSRGKVVALATVIRSDGYLVTKASELNGPARIRLEGNEYPARIVNGDHANDLALIKISAERLTPVQWATQPPALGSLLVTPNAQGKPLAISVVGVAARAIPESVNNLRIAPPPRPYLGVALLKLEKGKGIRIGSVPDAGPASKAGLKADDLIAAINDKAIDSIKMLDELIGKAKIGDEVKLTVQRGEETLMFTVTLGKRPMQEAKPSNDRRSAAQVYSARGGELSNRRTGFPNALTHDGVVWADGIGGPVLNLERQAVGLNIARYGRTATYALPADHAKQAIDRLMQGR